MTPTQRALLREQDTVMAALDSLIKTNGKSVGPLFAKSVTGGRADDDVDDEDVEEAEGEAQEFPPTREGLALYAQSPLMQNLRRHNPAEFRRRYLDFVLSGELIRKGEVLPSEFNEWSHRLDVAPGGELHRHAMAKAVSHVDASPEPWSFERSPRGLAGFLASPVMRQLEQTHQGLWRKHHLDFFSSMEPQPTPQAISSKRLELEASCPDRPLHAGHHFSKAVSAGSQPSKLTTGQQIVAANFGLTFGDPAMWLRNR